MEGVMAGGFMPEIPCQHMPPWPYLCDRIDGSRLLFQPELWFWVL